MLLIMCCMQELRSPIPAVQRIRQGNLYDLEANIIYIKNCSVTKLGFCKTNTGDSKSPIFELFSSPMGIGFSLKTSPPSAAGLA